MNKVIYTKFNSTRKTEFQIKTSIIIRDGNKYVIKKAMTDTAKKHLENIALNYNVLKDYYNDIKLVSCDASEKSMEFSFINGKSLMSDIDFLNDDVKTLVEKISYILDIILNIKDEYKKQFEISDRFKEMFPDCEPQKEDAFRKANLDSIFDNFIKVNEDIFCIDYEWVCDFDIPVNYVKYRALFYLYMEHIDLMRKKISLEDFLSSFDVDDIELYQHMEECFQQYVHGENRKYIYTKNYIKNTHSLEYLIDKEKENKVLHSDKERLTQEIELKENHVSNLDGIIKNLNKTIENLEERIAGLNATAAQCNELILNKDKEIAAKDQYIAKLHKSIKNPIYAARVVGAKVKKKIQNNTQEANIDITENEKIRDAYKEEYKHLIGIQEANYDSMIRCLESEERYDEEFEYNPKISIIVPVYNVLDKHLIPCIESVIAQVYTNWELCLADDCSTWDSVRQTLKKYESNGKIKIVYREENGHISLCSNSALEVATGEYIAFLDCDDVLRPNALYEMVKKLNENPELDFIYSDEDKIYDDGGVRHMPHFKPDWSPDTMMAHMYTCHFSIYRRSIANEIGGLRKGFEGAQDYDFVLRFTEKTDKIAHIAKILYHWREREESTSGNADAKPYVIEAARKSKEEALIRRGLEAELEYVDIMHQFRVNYKSKTNPKISIIIPSKDNYSILERCIRTLTELTSYKNYEIVLVDNGSNDENKSKYAELCEQNNAKYIYEKMEFNFSKMCNIGAKNATGEYYLFLNDDIEIINSEWLERMIGQAELPHSGAVGAKLLYPDSTKIQHVGVINIDNGPCHAFSGYDDKNIYYFGRNRLTYNYVAVTAACLLVNAKKYNQIGGFDEELRVAYNDVDLCFKLVEAGYYNVVRSDVELYHHESISRGDDTANKEKMERLMKEQARLYEKHNKLAKYDPFYNVNLSQNSIDFSLNNKQSRVLYNEVKNCTEEYESIDTITGSIDEIIKDEYIIVRGWFVNNASDKNNEAIRKIILQNDISRYIVSTTQEYRKDVGDAMLEKPDVDFCGFVCNIKKEDIKTGTYNVYFVWNEEKWLTGGQLNV